MGQAEPKADQVLHWERKVLSAEDLRASLNGQSEIRLGARAVVTPLAREHLQARGVRVVRTHQVAGGTQDKDAGTWAYAAYRPDPTLATLVQGLGREGVLLNEVQPPTEPGVARWVKGLAEWTIQASVTGLFLFCDHPALANCVANKVKGIRAAEVATTAQAGQAALDLAPNFVAIPLLGPTLFELRSIVRTLTRPVTCPAATALTVEEIEGHARR